MDADEPLPPVYGAARVALQDLISARVSLCVATPCSRSIHCGVLRKPEDGRDERFAVCTEAGHDVFVDVPEDATSKVQFWPAPSDVLICVSWSIGEVRFEAAWMPLDPDEARKRLHDLCRRVLWDLFKAAEEAKP